MWKTKSTPIILAMILPDTWCSADNAGKKTTGPSALRGLKVLPSRPPSIGNPLNLSNPPSSG